jgi:hypothetical protein
MVSSGMLHRVALVRTDVAKKRSASIIRVTRIGELGTTLKNGVFWVVTRATRRNNPEDTILHSHRRENLKSYIATEVLCEEIQNKKKGKEILCISSQLASDASYD